MPNSIDILQYLPSAESVNNIKTLLGTSDDTSDTSSVYGKLKEIRENISSSGGGSGSGVSDNLILANTLLRGDTDDYEWVLRQNGIGYVLNSVFNLNSDELASCETAEDISNNSTALDAIASNDTALNICQYNTTLAQALETILNSPERVLSRGEGYLKYNVGDLITLPYGGVDTQFRVVHKNYLTQNTITLCTENIVTSMVYDADSSNYGTSDLRTYLNSTAISQFSDIIQNAIKSTTITYYTVDADENTTKCTCSDKIWALSCNEVGFYTMDYKTIEGNAMSYFTSNSKRIKKLNGKASTWYLRTPYTQYTVGVWSVNASGSHDTYGGSCKTASGVVFAFEI